MPKILGPRKRQISCYNFKKKDWNGNFNSETLENYEIHVKKKKILSMTIKKLKESCTSSKLFCSMNEIDKDTVIKQQLV